jgi:hypothetical protein
LEEDLAVSTRGLLLLACAAAAGCAPTYHTPPAYRFDRPRSEALEARAEAECRARGGPGTVPERRFVTDGCTLWPDGWWTGLTWQECCVAHDIAYWCGGPDRSEADREFAECVGAAYSGWMGYLMQGGSRVLAGRFVPAHWRWGFGHDYPAQE